MKEYIERATVLNLLGKINPVDFGSMFDYEAHGAVQECLREISYGVEAIPAADVAEVRHGRWDASDRYKFLDGSTCIRCTECGAALHLEEYQKYHWHYCPNCGALMREDDNGKE